MRHYSWKERKKKKEEQKQKQKSQVNGNTHCSTSGPACSVGVTCKQQKKRGEKTYQVNPNMGLMPLPVQHQWSFCGSKRVVGCMPTTGHIGGTCASAARLLLLRPCDGTAASASGQVKAGACEDGVWMCVERVRKCTGLGKKKRNPKKWKMKRQKKKGKWTHCEAIHQLHATGSLRPVVSW